MSLARAVEQETAGEQADFCIVLFTCSPALFAERKLEGSETGITADC